MFSIEEYEARINNLIDAHSQLQERNNKLLKCVKWYADNFDEGEEATKLLLELGEL